jgi:hypothetical protein
MGGLIPTPNDLEVVAKLNSRFSSAGLTGLRNYQAATGDVLFQNPLHARTLERVSVRLGIYPSTHWGRGRWLYFLANVLKPSGGGATYNIIAQILAQAVATANVDSVVFNVIEDPALAAGTYILFPNNAANALPAAGGTGPRRSHDAPPGTEIYLITLVCPSAATFPYGVEPPSDGGEPASPIVP